MSSVTKYPRHHTAVVAANTPSDAQVRRLRTRRRITVQHSLAGPTTNAWITKTLVAPAQFSVWLASSRPAAGRLNEFVMPLEPQIEALGVRSGKDRGKSERADA